MTTQDTSGSLPVPLPNGCASGPAAALAGALGPPPWIVGHRGAAGEALENTLESLRLAVRQAVDMVEVDVQLTADDRLVLFHDRDLERLAGEAGAVESLPLDRLRRVELRSDTARRLRIPTAEEGLAALPAQLPVNLELKRFTADPGRFAEALARLVARRPLVLVSSFDHDLLAAVSRRLPEVPLAPLAKRGRRGLLRAGDELDAFSLHCSRRLARRRLVRAARAVRRPVLAYTVNEVWRARRLLRRGVSGLFSDHPGRLRRELEDR